MLYSLGHPKIFLVLLVGLVLAWIVHVAGQRLLQRLVPETKWYLQRRPGVAALVDPFAAVAALLSPAAVGWTPPVEWAGHRGRKRPLVLLLLAGPAANLVAGCVIIAAAVAWASAAAVQSVLRSWADAHLLGDFVDLADLFGGPSSPGFLTVGFAKDALFLIGIVQLLVAVISLIPLPPLEGGRLLFLFTPKTVGWQKAEYNLAERNIGLIIVLVGLVRISSGLTPPFAYLGDVIARAVALGISHL